MHLDPLSEALRYKSSQKGNCNIFQMSDSPGKAAAFVWESSGKEFWTGVEHEMDLDLGTFRKWWATGGPNSEKNATV